jgi:hypothetical protein
MIATRAHRTAKDGGFYQTSAFRRSAGLCSNALPPDVARQYLCVDTCDPDAEISLAMPGLRSRGLAATKTINVHLLAFEFRVDHFSGHFGAGDQGRTDFDVIFVAYKQYAIESNFFGVVSQGSQIYVKNVALTYTKLLAAIFYYCIHLAYSCNFTLLSTVEPRDYRHLQELVKPSFPLITALRRQRRRFQRLFPSKTIVIRRRTPNNQASSRHPNGLKCGFFPTKMELVARPRI